MAIKKRLLSNNYFYIFSLCLLFLASIFCSELRMHIDKHNFCDTCEFSVIKKTFEIANIHINYTDFSNLDSIKQAVYPIRNVYLKEINMEKYVQDTLAKKYFRVEILKKYSDLLGTDTILKNKDFTAYSKGLFTSAQIDSLVKLKVGNKYIEFSKPLFDKEKKTVLVEVNINCNGLCGEGYIYIFEKKSEQWILLHKVFLWVS